MPASRPPVIVVAPDSFKGSLDAPAICAAVARGLRRVWPDAEVRACPMADGGEGTLAAVLSRGGERRVRSVSGADGAQRAVAYGIVAAPEGATAIIEVAEIVGITDPDGMAIAVSARSTGGVGELIIALLDAGVRHFMIGLGGSSTNDGGAGMLAALGLRLAAGNGDAVAPTPAGLANLASADAGGLDPRLPECAITIMSDVNNPLCGERGATAIFGPQKGVRAGEVAAVDATLARFAALAERAVGGSAAGQPGAGAAGGLGFALQLVGGSFRSGAEVVADLIGLDAALADADWAFTGEGRTDAQTLLRKAPFVVAERARAAGVPITLLSGAIDAAALPELGRVFDGCFALPAGPMALADCIAQADVLLTDRAEEIARVWSAAADLAASRMNSRVTRQRHEPEEGTAMSDRPFRILGLQQVAIGGLDKQRLRALWVDTLGLEATGTYRSTRENVDEDILAVGRGLFRIEVDLMQPLDAARKPAVHDPALNHIGLWVDDLAAAVAWLGAQGVRFTPGGIRTGAAGHDVCFIHPKGSEAAPLGGEGVLIELVQAPPEVIAAFA